MVVNLVDAQKYFTRSGKITFFSDAPLEDIKAVNNSATSVLDAETGRLEFSVLIKGFQFEKAKMQQDFNENYMESSKYPKSTFRGNIQNWGEVDLGKDGTYELQVSGDLTIHGVTQPLETDAKLTVDGEQLSAHTSFMVKVADFDIEIPSVVSKKIAETVEVTVDVDYKPLKQN